MAGNTKIKLRKYLTENKFQVFEKNFEKHMGNIVDSFGKIDDRFIKIEEKLSQHDKAFALLLKNMQTFTEEAREHRQTMSSLMRTDISQERSIEELKERVDRLEMRIK